MAQLEDALLLHPVNEVGVVFRVAAEKIFFYLRIFDDDVFPRLRVSAGHRPPPRFKNVVDVAVRNRIGLQLTHAGAAANDVIEKIVAWGAV